MEGPAPSDGWLGWWRRWEGHVRFACWCALYLTAIGLTALLLGYIVTAPAVAHGQASQPASLPAIPTKSAWLLTWWPLLAAGLGYLLANLATALSDYPQAQNAKTTLAKVIRVIRLLAALVGVVHFSNTGGTGLSLKVIGMPVTESKINPPTP